MSHKVTTTLTALGSTNQLTSLDQNQETTIQKIKNDITLYEISNKQTSKILIESTKQKITKENLYHTLKQDLKYHKTINNNFKQYKEYVDRVSNYYAKNKADIEHYCTTLQLELKDFINIMKSYENNQQDLLDERNILIKSSEALIEHKLNEQNKLKEKLFTLSKDLTEQTTILDNVNHRLKELNDESDERRNKLNDHEKEEIEKYEALMIKYKVIEKRYNFYYGMEMEKQKKLIEDDKQKHDNKLEYEKIDVELKEQATKYDNLYSIVSDLKSKIQQIENEKTQKLIEKEEYKIFGKAFLKKKEHKKESQNKRDQFANIIHYRDSSVGVLSKTNGTNWTSVSCITSQ